MKNMLKKLFYIIKKIVVSICILYGLNLIISAVNVIIPINITTILTTTVLGIPGLFSIIILYLII